MPRSMMNIRWMSNLLGLRRRLPINPTLEVSYERLQEWKYLAR